LAGPIYRPSYPYSTRRRPVRWPWTVGTIALLAIVAMTALLVGGRLNDPNPDDLLAIAQTGTPDDELALEDATPSEIPPTNTPEPTPTEIDTGGSVRTADNWLAAWQAGDYDAMYDMISAASQKAITREDFVARYQGIADKAGLTKITATRNGDPGLDGTVPYIVTYTSNLVGDYSEKNAIPIIKEEAGWTVQWSPSLIFRDLGADTCIDFAGTTPTRGTIYDRNGNVLAEDSVFAQVGVSVGQVEDPTTYDDLSAIIDMPADDIREAVEGNPENWQVPLKNFPSKQTTELLNAVQGIPGVTVTQTTARTYPYGSLTAHVVGWVTAVTQEDIDADDTGTVESGQMIGRSGIEAGANDLLAGASGGKLEIVNCDTRAIDKIIAERAPTPSQDVYLTIDVDFQKQVDAALTAQVNAEQRAAAVVLDPQTGAVLAMVSHPTFDPNGYITTDFSEKDLQLMNDGLANAEMNRVASQSAPTGSIFKVITTAAAMKYLDYDENTMIDCPATFSIGEQSWNDWVVENGVAPQGTLTLHDGLVQSCNSVFYQIGQTLDDEDSSYLPDMAKAFGLGAKTGIPYFPEVAGVIPDPEWKSEVIGDGWSTGDAVNMAIGQGYVLATPLQMAVAYAAIANGGTVLQPYLVDRTRNTGEEQTTQVGKRVENGDLGLSTEQITQLQDMLRDQTSNTRGVGSSKVFGDFSFEISGKTGTAENSLDGTNKPHGWFAGYGPGQNDEPTIASVVMFENVGEGGTYAAPATRKIYESYIADGLAKRQRETPDTTTTEENPATPEADEDGS